MAAEAKRGNAEAQFELGMYYYGEMGTSPDYRAAATWFHRAAEQGHAAAQLTLGQMHLNGEGMLPDEIEAAKWIRKAAEQGYAPAQDELAILYSSGVGVFGDAAEALDWAAKAAEQGYPPAQHRLGCMLSTNAPGRGPADLVAACVWLSLAAGEGLDEEESSLETLKRRLTPAQLDEVRRRIELWKQKHGAVP